MSDKLTFDDITPIPPETAVMFMQNGKLRIRYADGTIVDVPRPDDLREMLALLREVARGEKAADECGDHTPLGTEGACRLYALLARIDKENGR